MNKEVTLILKGLHLSAGEENNLESCLRGNYFFKNGRHFVMAKEDNEGVITDMRLTFDENSLTVRRSGEVVTELVFEKDKKHDTMYRTPFGAIPIQTSTKEYYVNLKELEDGLIEGALKYSLYVDGNPQSEATLVFKIENR